MKSLPLAVLAAVTLFAASPDASAEDWFFRVGAHVVDPRSDNGSLADGALDTRIGSDARPTLVLGRFLDASWAIELLASLPFKHEVRLNGVHAADFKHLPPTLSAQYYFAPESRFRPFVGLGVNYTYTFDVEETGPLAGTETSVGNSFGAAAQVGVLAQLNDSLQLVADARWIDIDADVSVNGAHVGSVAVDPLVYGVYLGWSF